MAKFISDENIRLNIIINGGNKLQSELTLLDAKTRKLSNSNKDLRAAKTKLRLEGKKGTEEYKRLSNEITANNLVLRKNKARMAELQKEIGITGLTMRQLSQEARLLKLKLNNAIPGSAAERKYRSELKKVSGRLTELNIKAKATKLSLSSISRGFNKYIALGASVIGTGTGMVLAAQKLIDVNNKLSDAQADVMKTTGLTKKEVDELTKSFGLFVTRTSRIDLLKIAEAGGRIGIAKKDIAAFTKEMNKANVALGDTFTGGAEEVATKLGKLKTLFKETRNLGVSKTYNAIGSAINQLGASGKATEIEITDFATGVGSLPDAMKPTISEALGLGAAFAESGIQANKSGRAYGIFIRKAATETDKFAKVMGLSTQQVNDLINTNPTEFFLQFTKSLKGVSNTDTAEVLKDLGLNADGVNKIVGTAGNNVDRFRELLDISNKSMVEGTSLTKEYNIKNRNLSGILATIGNIFQNKFTGSKIQNYLKDIASGFLSIITPAKDLSQEFFDSKINVAALESNISPLLSRYDDLKGKANLTKKEQKELDDIILKVSEDIPTAITQFDKYGKAMDISTTSAKAFITQQQNLLKVKNAKAIDQATKKLELQKEALETLNHTYQLGEDGILRYFEAPKGIAPAGQDFLTKATIAQVVAFQTQLKAINDNIDGYTALIHKLEGAKTAKEKAAEAALKKAAADKKAADEAKNKAEDEKNRLRIKKTIYNKTETEITKWITTEENKRKINLKKGLDKELAQIDEKYRVEIEKAKGHKSKIKQLESLRNKEKQAATKLYNIKLATIQQKAATKHFNELKHQFDIEKSIRKTKYNKQLLALGNNEVAKANLKKQYEEKELDEQKIFLNRLVQENQTILDNLNKNVNLSLLTPEQTKVFEDNITKLKEKISSLLLEIQKLKGGNVSATDFGILQGTGTDILGFSPDQWDSVFNNMGTLEEKLKSVEIVFGGLQRAWSMYSKFVIGNQQKELKALDKKQTIERNKLKAQLDSKQISQEQYNQKIKKLDDEKENAQANADFKRAKNERIGALFSIATSTGIGIMKAVAASPLTGGMPWTAIIGGLGALEAAMVLGTPLPAKGYQDGLYPVQRQQDGKLFNAVYGGNVTSGLVSRPTVFNAGRNQFLAGEQGASMPEMIIDGAAYKKMNPQIKYALQREIGRIKGFEVGLYPKQTIQQNFTQSSTESVDNSEMYQELMSMIQKNTEALNDLKESGVIAYMSRDLRNAKLIRDDIKAYETLRNKNKIS